MLALTRHIPHRSCMLLLCLCISIPKDDTGTLRLLKSLRAYILDDEESVEKELLKDVEFLFQCLWGTADTAPLTSKLEYTIGYFDRCGRPRHALKGTILVQGELLPDIVHKECVKAAGIGADEVENDLWLSERYALYTICESSIVGVSYSRFRESFPRIMLVLKKEYVNTAQHKKINSTALKSLKNVTDDENPCRICYSASDDCIICTHCHRPVICEDCADEMMKLSSEQGFKCPNCRGGWSEIVYELGHDLKPAIHSGLFNRLTAQAAKMAEKKEEQAAQ